MRQWAGACALAPFPVDDDAAVTVARALGLPFDAWALRRLRADADRRGVGLAWSDDARVERVSALVAAERHSEGRPTDGSRLARTLAFWKTRCDDEAARERGSMSASEWNVTEAGARIAVDRALLQLWSAPIPAAEALARAAERGFETAMREGLAWLAPADRPCAGCATLPWRLDASKSAQASHWLVTYGLGARGGLRGEARLYRPGRQWLGTGLLAGLGVAALAAALGRETPAPDIDLRLPTPDVAAWAEQDIDGDPTRTFAVRTHHVGSAPVEAASGQRVEARWTRASITCREARPDGGVVFRCGRLPRAADTLPGAPKIRIALFVGESADAWQLAADALLDARSVGVVY